MTKTHFSVVLIMALMAMPLIAFAGQIYQVKIIDRQDSASNYSYVVPGYSSATTTGNANCTAWGNSANCYGNSTTSGISTPGMVGSYQVKGATLSLELPDGRIAVVNCDAKVNWTEWTNPGMYRSCRAPLVTNIQADFDKDKAKLTWPVSIDGKTMQKETYKIIAILEKPSVSIQPNAEKIIP